MNLILSRVDQNLPLRTSALSLQTNEGEGLRGRLGHKSTFARNFQTEHEHGVPVEAPGT